MYYLLSSTIIFKVKSDWNTKSGATPSCQQSLKCCTLIGGKRWRWDVKLLHVACCMLHVACCMLHVTCCELCAVRGVPSMPGSRCVLCAMYYVLRIACYVLCAVCRMWRLACVWTCVLHVVC